MFRFVLSCLNHRLHGLHREDSLLSVRFSVNAENSARLQTEPTSGRSRILKDQGSESLLQKKSSGLESLPTNESNA